MKTVRTRAVESVLILVQQKRFAGATVHTRIVHAAYERHGAVLAAVVCLTVAVIIRYSVYAAAVDARLIFFTLVDV